MRKNDNCITLEQRINQRKAKCRREFSREILCKTTINQISKGIAIYSTSINF